MNCIVIASHLGQAISFTYGRHRFLKVVLGWGTKVVDEFPEELESIT